MAKEGERDLKGKALSDLEIGEEARILALRGDPRIKSRLLQMGMVPGAAVRVEKVAPLGDPLEVVVKGMHLSLRREEAACVLVEGGRGR